MCESTDEESLVVEQDPIPRSELDLPLGRALLRNGVATVVRSRLPCWRGSKAPPPASTDCRGTSDAERSIGRRPDTRVEKKCTRTDRKVGGNAPPVVRSVGREISAEERGGHDRRSCGRCGDTGPVLRRSGRLGGRLGDSRACRRRRYRVACRWFDDCADASVALRRCARASWRRFSHLARAEPDRDPDERREECRSNHGADGDRANFFPEETGCSPSCTGRSEGMPTERVAGAFSSAAMAGVGVGGSTAIPRASQKSSRFFRLVATKG